MLLTAIPCIASAESAIERGLPAISILRGPDNPAARCAVDQDRQNRKKPRRGVLGWLYRYTRNVDVERGNMPVPLYLRSPLLTSVPMPDCDSLPAADRHEQCAVVAIEPLKDASFDATVTLPQLGANTPAHLADAIRAKLADDESLVLHTTAGTHLEISAHTTRRVETRNCVIDA